ncbi:hypothetical protein FPV67DRAFT_1404455 [Lyophyllum atratum]|nr:hypothetical protein FPV67DRAFT_1404455 [Lyophyllum atratum]
MTVIEFASIALIEPNTLQTDPIPALFQKGCTLQAAFSSHPAHLFQDVSDPFSAYIIAGWQDVAQHMQSIESEPNKAVMADITKYMGLKALAHPEIEFSTFPEDADVVTVEKYAAEQGPGASDSRAKWVGAGIDDETRAGYKISVYGAEDGDSVVSSTSEAGSERLVMRRVTTFKA